MSTDGERRRCFSRLANAQGSCPLGPKYRLSNRVYSARTGQPLTAAYLFAPNVYRIAKLGRVEDGRGGLGHAASPRFPSPLIKPDVRIARIRLSDWLHRKAHGGGPRCTRRSRNTPNSPNTRASENRVVPRPCALCRLRRNARTRS